MLGRTVATSIAKGARGFKSSAARLGEHHHPHTGFAPPFKKRNVGLIISTIVLGGPTIVLWSVNYQQHKEGYWKK